MNELRLPARDFRLLYPFSKRQALRLLALCVPLLLVASDAFGQRLLNIVPLGDDPTADGWAVEVDHDLVRSAPQRLEFEAPDGRVFTPRMRVFEDRGDGNAMWVGGYPELGYDNVLLTLQDGHLLGRLGLPEGGAYWLRPGNGGGSEGLLTEAQATTLNCGGGVLPEADLATPAVGMARADVPRRVASESNHDRLDILMLYTAEAADWMGQAGWGEPGAQMQQAIDYLNLVFSNNQIEVTANMVHHAQAPAELNVASGTLGRLRQSSEVADLRAEHDADLAHLFFYTEQDPGLCGQAYLMRRGGTAANFWSWGYGITSARCVDVASQVRDGEYGWQFEVFAHEIGHNLGANHDPDNAGSPDDAVYPYAFGHHNFTPQPNVKSVMSYNEGRQEPFFSTTRVRPRGFQIGVEGERENERAMQQTIHVGVRFSDYLPAPGEPPEPPPGGGRPAAPTGLSVIGTGPTSVRLTWTDTSDNELGFQVHARLAGGGWDTAADLPPNTESADIDGLQAGARYDFRVRAFNGSGGRNSGVTTIVLREAEYTDCVPSESQITFEHGFTVSMCVEYQKDGETVMEDAQDYGLESRESGILYFFDRDNAEVLVKVLDACAVNDHRWVFVAPVTDLAFNLYVDETATGERWEHRNPRGGQIASTKSDVAAFPCRAGGSTATAAGAGGAPGVELVDSGLPQVPLDVSASVPARPAPAAPVGVAQAIAAGEGTDCEPRPVATLAGGYTVNMCVEYLKEGVAEVREARDFGLDSQQSGLLYFFEPSNAEVLIKVLDGCGVNGHRWVFVAPVTDLAFNLTVVSPNPDEDPWTHSNRFSQTASPKSDTAAFVCSN